MNSLTQAMGPSYEKPSKMQMCAMRSAAVDRPQRTGIGGPWLRLSRIDRPDRHLAHSAALLVGDRAGDDGNGRAG